MKFDPSAILYTIEEGKPFMAGQRDTGEKDDAGAPITENVPMSLGVAIARALQTEDPKSTAEERIRRTRLAMEVVGALDDGTVLDWTTDAIAEVKKLCLTMWTHPVVYFRIDELLEGRAEPSTNGSVSEEIDKITAGPLLKQKE